ncbi:carboxylating nicotinate-nucleotide diphosphorylase [Acidithrix ferrooxidans]|uniref:Nicotinate-nucleotide pyrophosphorylase [carboxylating] n=1 Tax=Acidithrix ferrooxidans TaxID=1280514 RepID=A0A0D8HI84_9ACTN|nr:carboxylating nicotinate-nucleotide diphosphorylase [Acidithrix ferrooxidans]KJF17472.1 putative nicotinate-nucleotide pyrophosphorylase [Acidithrix ferrooxidans]
MTQLDFRHLRGDISRWIEEDLGAGDITSILTIPNERSGEAVFVSKGDAIISGLPIAREIFRTIDSDVFFELEVDEGSHVRNGEVLARVRGNLRSILASERLSLNLIQRLSGISTMTSTFVAEARGTKAKIADSRKTTPGLRYLEKYAVKVGGGVNHRFGLFDGILIKDNHIESLGSVRAATMAAKANAPHYLKVEVEVSNLDELQEALESGADGVLLDNMDDRSTEEAVRIVAGRVLVEASGNMVLSRIAQVSRIGVDLISVGALTHSANAIDISLDIS